MAATARLIRHGDVAVIEMDNPPVNALAHGLREGLGRCLDEALGDPSIVAIVLAGAGRLFCGGADLRELGTPANALPPVSRDLRRQMERADKPIVAALHGSALGGGLEMALACHYRVAAPGTQTGLPEVQRGILPGGGGTQRLPRLIGVEAALSTIVWGETFSPARALELGVIDQLIEGELREGAVAFARQKAAQGGPHPVLADQRVSVPDAESWFDGVRQQIQSRQRGLVAPLEALECVRAATTLPFEEGLDFERARFQVLIEGPQSRALRHIFFAERESSRIPGLPDAVATRPVRRIGVVGAGTMGTGIAMSAANAGLPVIQLEMTQAALDRGRAQMTRLYAGTVSKGRLTQAEADRRIALVQGTLDFSALADVDLVIEAAFEEMSVKEEVFRKLDAVCKPGAILSSNTSRLDIDRIASFTGRPADVIGLHFFAPANVMRLLEVVRGAASADDVIATSMALGKTLRKLPVLVGNCDGFVGNRMLSCYTREAGFLLEEGASPRQVDQAMVRFGMAMGPFAVGDLSGLDIGWANRKRLAPTRPPHLRYSRVADALCEAGRFGQKTGSGWYRYESGQRTPIDDPAVDAIIERCAAEAGITRRAISDEEVIERTLYALINEGARILEEGMALRASDIDLVYVNGYGFPAWRGGPMHYATEVGIGRVAERIQQFHAEHGEWWTPAPLLLRKAAEGARAFD